MITPVRTLIKLIALNGRDFIDASQDFLAHADPSIKAVEPRSNLNHVQAKMLGWAKLLHLYTGMLIEGYKEYPMHSESQGDVDDAYTAYIIEGKENPAIIEHKTVMVPSVD